MGGIPFANVPQGIRTPLFWAEVNNALANTASSPQRALIIGQMTAAGQLFPVPNYPVIVQSLTDGAYKGGPGSQIDLMVRAYRANDPEGELWCLPVLDNGAGVAATGTLLVGGSPTAAGVLSLYVAGQLVSVSITIGQTVGQIAAAITAAVNAIASLPVTAGWSTATVTFTAKNKGTPGNDIDLRLNYVGWQAGEVTPAGMTATITPMSAGATNPVLTTALGNLLDKPFDFIISPYTDPTSIAAISALLNDQTGRWSFQTQVFGGCFIAYRGTYGALTTFGVTNNDQHTSCMGMYDSPSPNWLWAAAVAGAAAPSIRNDPAMPLHTLRVQGVLPPPIYSRFSQAQRNTLLGDGISTFNVDEAGNISIELLVTTYQQNSFGQPDNSYYKVETMFTLMAVVRTLKTSITSKFSRMKLADDGTRFAPGSAIVTPSIIRADQIAEYREMEYNGLVQASAAFAAGLIVQRNSGNPNRVDVLWDGILIDQLDIFALLAQFRLVAPTAIAP